VLQRAARRLLCWFKIATQSIFFIKRLKKILPFSTTHVLLHHLLFSSSRDLCVGAYSWIALTQNFRSPPWIASMTTENDDLMPPDYKNFFYRNVHILHQFIYTRAANHAGATALYWWRSVCSAVNDHLDQRSFQVKNGTVLSANWRDLNWCGIQGFQHAQVTEEVHFVGTRNSLKEHYGNNFKYCFKILEYDHACTSIIMQM
jgi:hypothetical protein